MIKRHLGALLSVASMGGGELMEFSLERSYRSKNNRPHHLSQNNNVEYYTDEKGQIKRRKKTCQSR